MQEVFIKTEFIKLGQALKLSGFVGSGTDAKYVIKDGLVRVDGETETRRGRKLFGGEIVTFDNGEEKQSFKVESVSEGRFS